jgi:Cdc6-like AAA superfamily ATPase
MPRKAASSLRRGRSLVGRDGECSELDSLREALHRGQSRSVVIRGEAGVGKTALLGYLTERATDCRVMTVTAVQS